MTSTLTRIGLLGATVLLQACNGTGSTPPRTEAPQAETGPAAQQRTAAQVLVEKVASLEGRNLRPQDLVVDSAGSQAAPGLSYYWTRRRGGDIHQFQVTTTASHRGRYFAPGNLRAWSTVWREWVPSSNDEALIVCLEAVSAGVVNTPNRLHTRDLLHLGTALRFVPPGDGDRIARVDAAPVVERDSASGGDWRVRFWYPDAGRPGRPARLATRYLCEVPGTRAGDAFRIVEVDSILKLD